MMTDEVFVFRKNERFRQ